MKSMIYIFLVILLFLSACNEQSITPDFENDSSKPHGLMKITLDMTNAPSEVVRLEGNLYNDSREEIYFDFEIDGNSATAFVEDIPSGIWRLQVDAFNEDNVIIYTGTTEITVYPGVVTPVSLHLNPGTGSLEIKVTWGNDPSLVAYYPFNGNANDESGNLNHGVVHGATLTTDRFGYPNRAYNFDGIDDFISVANSRSLESPASAVTITAWIYFREWDNGWVAVCVKSDNVIDGQYGVLLRQGGIFECYVSNKNVVLLTSYQFPVKKWWFCSMTYDGNQIKFYADGTLIKTESFSHPPGTNTYPLNIGKDTPGFVEHLNGKLDEIRIYNRALSESEIQSLFHSDGSEDDQFEENDRQSEAAPLIEYTYYNNLFVSVDDDDWYSMTLSADSLSIKCDFIHANGDINMDLVDKSGTVLASSQSLTDNERIHFIVNQLDTYYIHIYMSSVTSNTYTFWWDDIWQWEY